MLRNPDPDFYDYETYNPVTWRAQPPPAVPPAQAPASPWDLAGQVAVAALEALGRTLPDPGRRVLVAEAVVLVKRAVRG